MGTATPAVPRRPVSEAHGVCSWEGHTAGIWVWQSTGPMLLPIGADAHSTLTALSVSFCVLQARP